MKKPVKPSFTTVVPGINKSTFEAPSSKRKVTGVIPSGTTLKMMAHVTSSSELTQLSEFHMTIQSKMSNLTTRQMSMLLTVGIVKALLQGVDISLYLALEFLSNGLKKSGVDVLYVKDERTRQSLLLVELLLLNIRGNWLTLGTHEKLPEEVIEQIQNSGWLPSKRTFDSWAQHWELEKYLSIRIVPVETLISRQPSTAERYSGYTRGYGQDGNPPAPHRTKEESSDGDVLPEPPTITLLEFEQYVNILNNIERARVLKKK